MTGRGGRMRAALLGAALFALAAGGAGAQGRPHAKIVVDASGAVTYEGRRVSPAELREELASLARWKGEVWYYRENPAADPPPAALAVIEAIMEARLPVRFATKPDFSAFDGEPPDPGVGAPDAR